MSDLYYLTLEQLYAKLPPKSHKSLTKLLKKVPAQKLEKHISAVNDWYQADSFDGRAIGAAGRFFAKLDVMDLSPKTYVGKLYRGIQDLAPDTKTFPLRLHPRRNYVSTTLAKKTACCFGDVIRILDPVVPVVAPPNHTTEWFDTVMCAFLLEMNGGRYCIDAQDLYRYKEQEVIVYSPAVVKVETVEQ